MNGLSLLPPIPYYESIEKNEAKAVASAEAGDTASTNLVSHFEAAAKSIKTPAQLLTDYRSLQVVLGAFGMSSMVGETAIIRKLMTQDPTAKTSLAATSNNTAWKAFAKSMSGWTSTSTPISSATNIATIVSNFGTNAFETASGKANPGMQQALYFTRNASSVTSVNALMSDSTLLNVAETVIGLDPSQFGALDFDQQKRIITKDVKLSEFATPAAIKRTAERYLAMTAADPPAVSKPFTTASLFQETDGSSLLGAIAGGLGVTV